MAKDGGSLVIFVNHSPGGLCGSADADSRLDEALQGGEAAAPMTEKK